MPELRCQVCGENDIVSNGKFFVCRKCGCKYTIEEIQRIYHSRQSASQNESPIHSAQQTYTEEYDYYDEYEDDDDYSYNSKKTGKYILIAVSLMVVLAMVAAFSVVFFKHFSKNSAPTISAIAESSTISAGSFHTVALKGDGTVVATGLEDMFVEVHNWKDIIAVSAGMFHTVGLKKDGTVVATCNSNNCNLCQALQDWENITAVSVGLFNIVALKGDGTVVATRSEVPGVFDVQDWKDIVAISAGCGYSVGLKKDGTVVATGDYSYGQCNVHSWKNIVAVSAGGAHTVGLKKDGTVVATGNNSYGQCNVHGWKDIVAVSAGDEHTIGLKKDGTVIATGDNSEGQCNVHSWKDIVAVSAGGAHTVGLKKGGTVVATGDNNFGQCDIADLTASVVLTLGDYTGKDFEQTKQMLEKKGIIVKVEKKPSNEYSKGEIIMHIPTKGVQMREGDEIIITVSEGVSYTYVPYVVGLSQYDAIAEIQNWNLEAKVIEETSNTVARGKVIRQNPNRNTMIATGETVEIYVSAGKEKVDDPSNPSGGNTDKPSSNKPRTISIPLTELDKNVPIKVKIMLDGKKVYEEDVITSTGSGTITFEIPAGINVVHGADIYYNDAYITTKEIFFEGI